MDILDEFSEVLMFKFLKNTDSVITYKITEDDIFRAEKRMGFKFPKSICEFYREIGYGFIKGNPNFINRIMAPDDIADFVCNDEVYEYVDKSIYGEDELVFMHISGEDFLTIEYKDGNEGAVKYFGKNIANSFVDFLKKMIETPNYYI